MRTATPSSVRVFRSVLPPTPSVNHTYRFARAGRRTRVYKTACAEEWGQVTDLVLRAAGFRTLAGEPCWISGKECHKYALIRSAGSSTMHVSDGSGGMASESAKSSSSGMWDFTAPSTLISTVKECPWCRRDSPA